MGLQRDSLCRITVCRIRTVYINTCCLVVKLSPYRFEVGRFLKIRRSLQTGFHRSESSASSKEQKRLVWMQFGIIRNGSFASIQRMFRFRATKVRIPVLRTTFD
jgi:hypothetical protein